MIRLRFLLPAILTVAACSCGGKEDPENIIEAGTVSTDPTELTIGPAGGELTVAVTASAAWTAYVSGETDWASVDPSYCPDLKGTLTVKVSPIVSNKSRSCEVVVKCGSTRHKIPLTQTGSTDVKIPEGYTLVWNDEFDKGDVLGSDWTHEVKNAYWVNNELQAYVNRQAPDGQKVTELEDGCLKITCLKGSDGKIYSGRVYAKRNTGWKYGWFEARIKLPSGSGSWPAFWMMPVNFTSWPADGEIDIMEEVGNNPNVVHSTIHCTKYNNTGTSKESARRNIGTAESDFHVYALEWTSAWMKFYVDDSLLLKYDNDGSGKNAWPFDAPFYIILNLAFGGDWGGAGGVNQNALPMSMYIDYVRVFQK